VLWKTIERHCLAGVLYEPISQVPTPLRARMQERRTAERLWGTRLVEALRQALAALEASQVKVVVLKGPVLSERLHGDPLLRWSADLDLLVDEADVDRALQSLDVLGYRETEAEPTSRYRRRHHHHIGLRGPGGLDLELHFRAHTGFGTSVPAAEVMARSVAYRTQAGWVCQGLCPEDEALYLLVHAAGHELERLCWLYDLKIFFARHPDLNWPVMANRARAWGLTHAAGFALKHVKALGGNCPGTLARPGHRSVADRMLAWLRTQSPDSGGAKLGALALQTVLCDGAGLAARHAQHHLGRMLRRRLQRWLPRFVPADWAG
jgi:hypothetical protein